MDQVSTDLASKFESMFAAKIRNLVNKIVDFIWPDNFGEIVKRAQLRKWADSYVGNALEERVGKAGVDLVGKIEIVRENLKNVMREACAEFIGPSWTWSPSPVAGNSLGPRMNVGAELCQKLEEIHAHNSVVAKEIGTTQSVMVANVVIDFSESVFRAVYVRVVE